MIHNKRLDEKARPRMIELQNRSVLMCDLVNNFVEHIWDRFLYIYIYAL